MSMLFSLKETLDSANGETCKCPYVVGAVRACEAEDLRHPGVLPGTLTELTRVL